MSLVIQRVNKKFLRIKFSKSPDDFIQSKPFRTSIGLAIWAHKHVPEDELKAINYYDQHLLAQIEANGDDWLDLWIKENFTKGHYEDVEN